MPTPLTPGQITVSAKPGPPQTDSTAAATAKRTMRSTPRGHPRQAPIRNRRLPRPPHPRTQDQTRSDALAQTPRLPRALPATHYPLDFIEASLTARATLGRTWGPNAKIRRPHWAQTRRLRPQTCTRRLGLAGLGRPVEREVISTNFAPGTSPRQVISGIRRVLSFVSGTPRRGARVHLQLLVSRREQCPPISVNSGAPPAEQSVRSGNPRATGRDDIAGSPLDS